ncbi:MAG TPA: 2-amino-4-hydroxy-6-hydroxymethyldihydropteridine diphosphokinase [Rhodanobacteraceae bacterium]|nr:2-amino-4-hydroxy-6-hydroxymethyldihydropteridine diphosphokinase [Rhodanobacteraceae bacterium]
MENRLAYVGIGSNLGDPVREVRAAIDALAALPRSRLSRVSRLFRTRPWGRVEQPAFVNAVAEISTSLSARELLDALLAIERARGRHRDGTRWGPRVLDLDILVYAKERIDEAGLRVPHPHLGERAFALLPLADIDPEIEVPALGRVRELLATVDTGGCEPLADARLEHSGSAAK